MTENTALMRLKTKFTKYLRAITQLCLPQQNGIFTWILGAYYVNRDLISMLLEKAGKVLPILRLIKTQLIQSHKMMRQKISHGKAVIEVLPDDEKLRSVKCS
jgi:hypothetical protein